MLVPLRSLMHSDEVMIIGYTIQQPRNLSAKEIEKGERSDLL